MDTTLRSLLLCAALAGCVTPSADPDPRKAWCDNSKPMRPGAAVFAVMTRPEIDDMNRHNTLGVEWCGWKP